MPPDTDMNIKIYDQKVDDSVLIHKVLRVYDHVENRAWRHYNAYYHRGTTLLRIIPKGEIFISPIKRDALLTSSTYTD